MKVDARTKAPEARARTWHLESSVRDVDVVRPRLLRDVRHVVAFSRRAHLVHHVATRGRCDGKAELRLPSLVPNNCGRDGGVTIRRDGAEQKRSWVEQVKREDKQRNPCKRQADKSQPVKGGDKSLVGLVHCCPGQTGSLVYCPRSSLRGSCVFRNSLLGFPQDLLDEVVFSDLVSGLSAMRHKLHRKNALIGDCCGSTHCRSRCSPRPSRS